MRTSLLLFALAALVLSAGAAQTTPLACADQCKIQGHAYATVPVVYEIKSGASVTWTALDASAHVSLDDWILRGAEICFMASYSATSPSPSVRFDIVDDTLTATVNGVTKECGNAEALDDGSFLLPYTCVLHPAPMRAALLVTP